MRLAGWVMALSLAAYGAGKPAKKAAAKKESPVALLLQLERDWSKAGTTRDTATMDRIMADDWVSVDFQGQTVTKAQALAGLKGAAGGPGVELGDMKVRVLGTTAIVQGKDKSGQFAWMDVFMKRNGKWQAVASQSTRVEK